MKLPKAAPGEGGRNEFENWSYWSVGKGETHFAYVAGECQWFVVHPSERTKPCLRWWSKGALVCKLCGAKPTAEVGYLPVWRGTDWRPKLVVVYGAEREQVDRLLLHQRVVVGREDDKGAQVYVRLAANQEPAFNTAREDRKRPADIGHCLLKLWDIPELLAYMAARAGESDTAMSLCLDLGGEKAPDPEPAEPVKPAAQPYTPPDEAHQRGGVDAALQRAMDRTRKREAEKNGKHG